MPGFDLQSLVSLDLRLTKENNLEFNNFRGFA